MTYLAAIDPKPSLGSKSESEIFLNDVQDYLEYAFQPIVDIATGTVFGYEALLRQHEKIGMPRTRSVFNHAWHLGILHQVDLLLREKAFSRFSEIPFRQNEVLFFNLDGRCFTSPDYAPEQTDILLKQFNLPLGSLCLEISERHNFEDPKQIKEILKSCRRKNFRFAIDDYGRGYSQLKILYDHQPDYIKIDPFFIGGIASDMQKQLMVKAIVHMAQALNIRVIAEGIENQQDLLFCRDIGCDFAQGFFIAQPTINLEKLSGKYDLD